METLTDVEKKRVDFILSEDSLSKIAHAANVSTTTIVDKLLENPMSSPNDLFQDHDPSAVKTILNDLTSKTIKPPEKELEKTEGVTKCVDNKMNKQMPTLKLKKIIPVGEVERKLDNDSNAGTTAMSEVSSTEQSMKHDLLAGPSPFSNKKCSTVINESVKELQILQKKKANAENDGRVKSSYNQSVANANIQIANQAANIGPQEKAVSPQYKEMTAGTTVVSQKKDFGSLTGFEKNDQPDHRAGYPVTHYTENEKMTHGARAASEANDFGNFGFLPGYENNARPDHGAGYPVTLYTDNVEMTHGARAAGEAKYYGNFGSLTGYKKNFGPDHRAGYPATYSIGNEDKKNSAYFGQGNDNRNHFINTKYEQSFTSGRGRGYNEQEYENYPLPGVVNQQRGYPTQAWQAPGHGFTNGNYQPHRIDPGAGSRWPSDRDSYILKQPLNANQPIWGPDRDTHNPIKYEQPPDFKNTVSPLAEAFFGKTLLPEKHKSGFSSFNKKVQNKKSTPHHDPKFSKMQSVESEESDVSHYLARQRGDGTEKLDLQRSATLPGPVQCFTNPEVPFVIDERPPYYAMDVYSQFGKLPIGKYFIIPHTEFQSYLNWKENLHCPVEDDNQHRQNDHQKLFGKGRKSSIRKEGRISATLNQQEMMNEARSEIHPDFLNTSDSNDESDKESFSVGQSNDLRNKGLKEVKEDTALAQKKSFSYKGDTLQTSNLEIHPDFLIEDSDDDDESDNVNIDSSYALNNLSKVRNPPSNLKNPELTSKKFSRNEEMEELLVLLEQSFPNSNKAILKSIVEESRGDGEYLQELIEEQLFPTLKNPPNIIDVNFDVQKKMACQLRQLKYNLPHLDHQFLRDKCDEFRGDESLVKNFIESERKKVKKGQLFDEQLAILLKALPDHDLIALQEEVNRLNGNKEAVELFIKEQRIEEKLEHLKLLLPTHNPEELRLTCEMCDGNQELLDTFVKDEKIKMDFERLKELFPSRDSETLKNASIQCDGDEALLESFIEKETEKIQKELIIETHFNRLLGLFPSVDQTFLKQKCISFDGDNFLLEDFIAEQQELERKNIIIAEQCQKLLRDFPSLDPFKLESDCYECQGDRALFLELKNRLNREVAVSGALCVLVDADPAFIDEMWIQAGGNTHNFQVSIENAIEQNNYPRIVEEDPEDRMKEAIWIHYVTNFELDDYLRRVPEPLEFLGSAGDNNTTDERIIINFFRGRYPDVDITEIENYFKTKNRNLSQVCKKLDKLYAPTHEINPDLKKADISERFLQEVAFITHRNLIVDYIEEENVLKSMKLDAAKKDNSLLSCLCCFDDELLYEDGVLCGKEHMFCKTCVKRCSQIALADGNGIVKCMTNCDSTFSLLALQSALPPSLMEKLVQKQQIVEIKNAQVEDIECCPHCEYAYIPLVEDRIFQCENPYCKKATCRLCKEPAHIPLRCEEVERPKDLAARRKIEEAMTDALVRKCYQCGKKFIKSDGCNKMTCSCGAMMCYLCFQPVKDYSHFNGQGGSNFERCPLWSNNEELHVLKVEQAGVVARQAELQDDPDVRIVHDPTTS